jgi:hypothetical protein
MLRNALSGPWNNLKKIYKLVITNSKTYFDLFSTTEKLITLMSLTKKVSLLQFVI